MNHYQSLMRRLFRWQRESTERQRPLHLSICPECRMPCNGPHQCRGSRVGIVTGRVVTCSLGCGWRGIDAFEHVHLQEAH